MGREWKPLAFQATLERHCGPDSGQWANAIGIEDWELDKLLNPPISMSAAVPHRRAPDASEVRYLEAQLKVDASVEGWVVSNPDVVDRPVGQEEFVAVLEPTGALAERWARGEHDAYREVLVSICKLAETEFVCAAGQVLRFCSTGIEFFLMDSPGEHQYRDKAAELGLSLKRRKATKTRYVQRRRFWLAEQHRR